jgi:hypothetical protein
MDKSIDNMFFIFEQQTCIDYYDNFYLTLKKKEIRKLFCSLATIKKLAVNIKNIIIIFCSKGIVDVFQMHSLFYISNFINIFLCNSQLKFFL